MKFRNISFTIVKMVKLVDPDKKVSIKKNIVHHTDMGINNEDNLLFTPPHSNLIET